MIDVWRVTDMESSWIGNIVEGLVTEISAEAAYSRYYSGIDKGVYDAVVAGRSNVDRAVQFILNALRDGDMSEDEAVRLSKGLMSVDNVTRQAILNRFRSGEYSNALEMLYDMESYDAEASRSALAKNGYVVIARSGWWLLTCTTTYEANHKWFPKTAWCTASDRLGRFDGYKMFCTYTSNACLFQLSTGDESHPFPEYQFSVSDTGRYTTICDDGNHEMSFDKSIGLVAQEWPELPEIIAQAAPKMIAETKRLKPVELKYQETREAYLARRKDIEKAKRERYIEQLRLRCKAMNEAETIAWRKAVEGRVSSGGYMDPEFVKSVIAEYMNDDYDMAVRNDYFRVKDVQLVGEYTIYMICPCVGWLYTVDDFNDEPEITKNDDFHNFFLYRRIGSNRTWLFYAITQNNINNIVSVKKVSETETPDIHESMVNIPDMVRNSASTNFVRIPSLTNNSDAILSKDDKQFHLIGKMNVDGYVRFGDINIFYSNRDHVIKCFDKTWNLADEIEFSDIVFSEYGIVSMEGNEMNFFGVNGTLEHKVLHLDFDTENIDIRTLFMEGGKYFVGMCYMGGYKEKSSNIISMDTGELVFGDSQRSIQTLNGLIWGFNINGIAKVIIYNPQDGTYILRKELSEDIPCDKYGNRIDTRG